LLGLFDLDLEEPFEHLVRHVGHHVQKESEALLLVLVFGVALAVAPQSDAVP
jgi:hypothetical protein